MINKTLLIKAIFSAGTLFLQLASLLNLLSQRRDRGISSDREEWNFFYISASLPSALRNLLEEKGLINRKINARSSRRWVTGLGVIAFAGDNRPRNSPSRLLPLAAGACRDALRERTAPGTGNFQFTPDRVINPVTSLVSARVCIYPEIGAGELSPGQRNQPLSTATSARDSRQVESCVGKSESETCVSPFCNGCATN